MGCDYGAQTMSVLGLEGRLDLADEQQPLQLVVRLAHGVDAVLLLDLVRAYKSI